PPAAPATPPATGDWAPLEQSQYMPQPDQYVPKAEQYVPQPDPQPNPFSEAANSIPHYPDPFTTPLPPEQPRPAPPPQPAVPSIFNSPNSPFSFAPQAATAPAPEPPPAPSEWVPSQLNAAPSQPAPPSPFTSVNSPFSVGATPTSFTPAPPVAATTGKVDKKA